MINQLKNRMANFIAGNDNQPIQYQPSGLTSNNMFADIMRTNQTYADIANSIKDISAKYNKDMTAFSDKYEGLMNDLLAKKNKYTGNIFKDFLTDYRDARESGVGSGIREGILGLFGGKKSIPSPYEYKFSNQAPEQEIQTGNIIPTELGSYWQPEQAWDTGAGKLSGIQTPFSYPPIQRMRFGR